jgi:hypothetical protein
MKLVSSMVLGLVASSAAFASVGPVYNFKNNSGCQVQVSTFGNLFYINAKKNFGKGTKQANLVIQRAVDPNEQAVDPSEQSHQMDPAQQISVQGNQQLDPQGIQQATQQGNLQSNRQLSQQAYNVSTANITAYCDSYNSLGAQVTGDGLYTIIECRNKTGAVRADLIANSNGSFEMSDLTFTGYHMRRSFWGYSARVDDSFSCHNLRLDFVQN